MNALKYSPDGLTLASGSADRHIFLWNAKTCAVSAERFGISHRKKNNNLLHTLAASLTETAFPYARSMCMQNTLSIKGHSAAITVSLQLCLRQSPKSLPPPFTGLFAEVLTLVLSLTSHADPLHPAGPVLDVRRQPNTVVLRGQDGQMLGRRDRAAGEEDEGAQGDCEQVRPAPGIPPCARALCAPNASWNERVHQLTLLSPPRSLSYVRRGPPLLVSASDDSAVLLWDLRVKGSQQTISEKFPVRCLRLLLGRGPWRLLWETTAGASRLTGSAHGRGFPLTF